LIEKYNWREEKYQFQADRYLGFLMKASDSGFIKQSDLLFRKIKGCIFQDFAEAQGVKTYLSGDGERALLYGTIWARAFLIGLVEKELIKEGYDVKSKTMKKLYLCKGFPFVESVSLELGSSRYLRAIKVAGIWYGVKGF